METFESPISHVNQNEVFFSALSIRTDNRIEMASPPTGAEVPAQGLVESWLAAGWNPDVSVDRSIALVAAQYDPATLADPLAEIVGFAPYRNFSVDNAPFNRSTGQSTWFLSFQHSLDLARGQLAISTNFTSLSAPPPDGAARQVIIFYRDLVDAFRGLGHVFAATCTATGDVSYLHERREAAHFERRGLMLDCSRGAVPTLATVKQFIARLALLGINTLMLYTEDTYEVPEEPFFGYLRGGFSQSDLGQIDEFAALFGIEVIPCIQTLGHLGQILQWPAYSYLRDTSEVLLVHSNDTYEFLARVLRAATAPFLTTKVHIGMDEAMGLGDGRHRQLFEGIPAPSRAQIFVDHLSMVTRICRDLGKEPLVWSDMMFCLATSHDVSLQGYYSASHALNIPAALAGARSPSPTTGLAPQVPLTPPMSATANDGSPVVGAPGTTGGTDSNGGCDSGLPLTTVYWDYYGTSAARYDDRIRAHVRDLGRGSVPPWVATGIWTWNRHWAALPFTLQTSRACLRAARDTGVQNVMTTVWGDDGNECDLMSIIPALVDFALCSYSDVDAAGQTNAQGSSVAPSPQRLSQWFSGVMGGKLADWVDASRIDNLHLHPAPESNATQFAPNMGKWLLWDDPSYAHLGRQAGNSAELVGHYSALTDRLTSATSRSVVDRYPLNVHLGIARAHARVLSLKVGLRERLRSAYMNGTLGELERMTDEDLSQVLDAVVGMWKIHRANWHSRFQPFGWEVIDLRYGGLRARLETLQFRIGAYLAAQGLMSQSQSGLYPQSMDMMMDAGGSGGSGEDSSATVRNRAAGEAHADKVYSLPELEAETHVIWEGAGRKVVLEYSRACTPMRAMGTG
ncbi:hypothetical protein BC828DRAFT_377458 [Blastocladiella britannica]|nr:hypothetical protein BC828DRAFT_377458 [Blastocladiella britannica]